MPKLCLSPIAGWYPKDINRFITSLIPSGKVVWQDDMEGTTLLWASVVGTLAFNTGGSNPLRGDSCASLTTNAGAESESDMLKRFGWLRNMVIGLEGWIRLPNISDLSYVYWTLEGFSGSQAIEFVIRYDVVNALLQYHTTGNVYRNIPGGAFPNWSDLIQMHSKLVVDFTNQLYMYFQIGSLHLDMRTLIPDVNPNVINPRWWPSYLIVTADGAAVMYVDDVIVTNEEVYLP